jgi:hypothetical protein
VLAKSKFVRVVLPLVLAASVLTSGTVPASAAVPTDGSYKCSSGIKDAGTPAYTITNGQIDNSSGRSCAGPLTIAPGVTGIGIDAFLTSTITSVVIPNTVTRIEPSAFDQSNLSSITFESGSQLNYIGWFAFYGTAITELILPNSLQTIDFKAFKFTQLNSVTIPDSIVSLGEDVFADTSSLIQYCYNGSLNQTALNYAGLSGKTKTCASTPAFTLSSSSETRTVNTAATGFTINSTGGTIASFSISPSSPAGMSFNTTTGAFTGTPTSVASATAYTVTATNASGSATRTFTLTVSAAAVVDNSAQQAAEAAVKREADKRAARAELVESLKNSQKVKFGLFDQAEILGITPANVDELYKEIFALPQETRDDISQVLKIARKYEVVGIVASERVKTIYSNSLIEIGLIPEESKYKATLTRVVKGLSQDERSSYAAIKVAIDAEMAEIQARKDQLTAVLTRIAARRAG